MGEQRSTVNRVLGALEGFNLNRPRVLALGPVDRGLMDMVMSVLDGIQATRRIRAEAAWQHIPVLGLTANVNPVDLQEFRKAGLNEVLLKPFEPAELCHRVEHLLMAKGGAA
jgi:CheY-like chemotaxis protein